MSYDDEERRNARPAARGFKRGEAPTSLHEVQRRMQECDDRLIELADELNYAQGRLVDVENAWKAHKATVNLLLAATGERTNEDLREAEAFDRSDSEGRTGKDLNFEYMSWKSQVETLQTVISTVQSRASTLRKHADTIMAAGG